MTRCIGLEKSILIDLRAHQQLATLGNGQLLPCVRSPLGARSIPILQRWTEILQPRGVEGSTRAIPQCGGLLGIFQSPLQRQGERFSGAREPEHGIGASLIDT